MIIGHLGVAAAATRWRPRVSLLWLIPAAIAPDLLDIAFAAAGVCNPYGLYSHTIPAAMLLAACLAGAAVLCGRREIAALVFLVVMLHLPLDYVTGRKLYWPGGEMYGLGWYDRRLADFAIESALAIGGWLLLRSGPGSPRWATAIWSIAGLLAAQGVVDGVQQGSLKPTACAIGTVTTSPERMFP